MNPWNRLAIDRQQYVLAEDLPYIQAFNARLESSQSARWIHTSGAPEPRQGPIDAPLVVLQLNPSFDKNTIGEPVPSGELMRRIGDIQDEYSPHACIADAHPWWHRCFSHLLNAVGRESLSNRVCSIEYFPYASEKFSHGHIRLPSQSYTFDLVRNALAGDALFLITRGLEFWLGAVPELLDAKREDRVFTTNNPRRVSCSPNNLPTGTYDRILAAIRRIDEN